MNIHYLIFFTHLLVRENHLLIYKMEMLTILKEMTEDDHFCFETTGIQHLYHLMSILFWNYKSARHRKFLITVNDLIRVQQLDILVIIKTKA